MAFKSYRRHMMPPGQDVGRYGGRPVIQPVETQPTMLGGPAVQPPPMIGPPATQSPSMLGPPTTQPPITTGTSVQMTGVPVVAQPKDPITTPVPTFATGGIAALGMPTMGRPVRQPPVRRQPPRMYSAGGIASAYPMGGAAKTLERQGRHGDSMLVHMNPAEVQALAKMSPTGKLTVNPATGQPEAFLPFLAALLGGMGGSAFLTGLGGLSAAAAGAIGSGLATTAATGSLEEGLVSGLTGYGIGSLFGALGSGAGEAGKAASEAAIAEGATQAQADLLAAQAEEAALANFGGFETMPEYLPADASVINPVGSAVAPSGNTLYVPSADAIPSGPAGGMERFKAAGRGIADAGLGGTLGMAKNPAILMALGEGSRSSMQAQREWEEEVKRIEREAGVDRVTAEIMAREIMPTNSPYYGTGPGFAEGGSIDETIADYLATLGDSGVLGIPDGVAQQQTVRGDTMIPAPEGYRPGIDPEWNYFPITNPPAFGTDPVTGEQLFSNFTPVPGETTNIEFYNAVSAGLTPSQQEWFGKLFADPKNEGLEESTWWSTAGWDKLEDSILTGGLNEENQQNLFDLLALGGRGVTPYYDSTTSGDQISTTIDNILKTANEYRARVGLPPLTDISQIGMARGGIVGNPKRYQGGGKVDELSKYSEGTAYMYMKDPKKELEKETKHLEKLEKQAEKIASKRKLFGNSDYDHMLSGYGSNDEEMQSNIFARQMSRQKISNILQYMNATGQGGGHISGNGGGMADDVPAMIDGRQPAAISSGEFVVPADVVSGLGDGNTSAGVKALYEMLDSVRGQRTGTKDQPKPVDLDKVMP